MEFGCPTKIKMA